MRERDGAADGGALQGSRGSDETVPYRTLRTKAVVLVRRHRRVLRLPILRRHQPEGPTGLPRPQILHGGSGADAGYVPGEAFVGAGEQPGRAFKRGAQVLRYL